MGAKPESSACMAAMIPVHPSGIRTGVRGYGGDAQADVVLTWSCLMPLSQADRSRRGSLTSRRSGSTSAIALKIRLISITARDLPRQKCGPPPPKPRCGFGSREMSNCSGFSNTSGSLLAEE